MPNYKINGWSFDMDGSDYPLSIEFSNVVHQGNNFAKFIRFKRIIIEYRDLTNNDIHSQVLSDDDFEKAEPVNFSTGSEGVKGFPYTMNGKLFRCKTKNNKLLFDKSSPLYVWFGIGVGSRGINPPHEFTGALYAARFLPVFKFATENKAIISIRVDYKFHFAVDSYLTKTKEPPPDNKSIVENFCAIIQDADHFPPTIITLIDGLNSFWHILNNLKEWSIFFSQCIINKILTAENPTIHFEYVLDKNEIHCKITSVPSAVSLGTEKPNTYKLKTRVDPKKLLQEITNFDNNDIKILIQKIIDDIKKNNTNRTQTEKAFVKWWEETLNRTNFLSEQNCKIAKTVFVEYFTTNTNNFLRQLEKDLQGVMPLIDIKKLKNLINRGKKLLIKPVGRDYYNEVIKLINDFIEITGEILTTVSFTAAEKPVLREMVGFFVKNSENYYDRGTWDNLHWWGTNKIPSAPGAFHAIHSHFHWADFLSYPKAGEADAINLLNKRMGTKEKNTGAKNLGLAQWRSAISSFSQQRLAGPLIDPKIPYQQIQFAITNFESKLFNELNIEPNYNTQSFKEIAEGLDADNSNPEEIAIVGKKQNKGSNIVFLLSCKAERPVDNLNIFEGAFLPNGFYFAHEEEMPFSFSKSTNAFAATRGVDLQKPNRSTNYPIFREPIKR